MPSGTCERCAAHRNWLHRHHIKPRCEGGTFEDGMLLLCANCHEDIHGGPMGGDSMRHRRQSPEAREKRSASLKKYYADPATREVRSEIARAVAARPGVNEKRSQTMRQRIDERDPAVEKARAAASAATRRMIAAEKNAERNSKIREMAAQGHGPTSIAVTLGISQGSVNHTLKLQREGLIP